MKLNFMIIVVELQKLFDLLQQFDYLCDEILLLYEDLQQQLLLDEQL
jgi:hypothetical protein